MVARVAKEIVSADNFYRLSHARVFGEKLKGSFPDLVKNYPDQMEFTQKYRVVLLQGIAPFVETHIHPNIQ